MPTSPHSSSEPSTLDRRRLEYERKEVKRALSLLRAQLATDQYVDDMLSPSELLAIRQALLAELDRLREISRMFARAEARVPTDDELKKALGI